MVTFTLTQHQPYPIAVPQFSPQRPHSRRSQCGPRARGRRPGTPLQCLLLSPDLAHTCEDCRQSRGLSMLFHVGVRLWCNRGKRVPVPTHTHTCFHCPGVPLRREKAWSWHAATWVPLKKGCWDKLVKGGHTVCEFIREAPKIGGSATADWCEESGGKCFLAVGLYMGWWQYPGTRQRW